MDVDEPCVEALWKRASELACRVPQAQGWTANLGQTQTPDPDDPQERPQREDNAGCGASALSLIEHGALLHGCNVARL